MFLYAPITIDDMKYDTYKYDGMLFMSVMNHPLIFVDERNGIDNMILPPSGFFVRSSQVKKVIKNNDKYEILSFKYDKNENIQKIINKIIDMYPDMLILGSKISAIVYDHIYGLVKYKNDNNIYNIKYSIRKFFVL